MGGPRSGVEVLSSRVLERERRQYDSVLVGERSSEVDLSTVGGEIMTQFCLYLL